MNEDRLLSELGDFAREREAEEAARLDERWDRLSHGDLSAEEEAELRALAEGSPEAREAYEAFRPLGPEFQAGVVQALQKAREEERRETEKKEKARVLSFPWFRATGFLATAAAAAVLVVLLRPPALPDYVLTQVLGVSTQRGEGTPEIPSAPPGGQFTLILRPKTPGPAERLKGGCFLSRDRETHSMETRSESAPGGSVRMRCTVPADVTPGLWTLWAMAGRPGSLPSSEELRSRTGPVQLRNVVVLSTEVRIQPRSGP